MSPENDPLENIASTASSDTDEKKKAKEKEKIIDREKAINKEKARKWWNISLMFFGGCVIIFLIIGFLLIPGKKDKDIGSIVSLFIALVVPMVMILGLVTYRLMQYWHEQYITRLLTKYEVDEYDFRPKLTKIQKSKKWLQKRLMEWGIVIVALTLVGWLVVQTADMTKFISLLVVLLVLALFSYWVIHRWYNRFIKDAEEDLDVSPNPYRGIFFTGVNFMAIILLLVGFMGAFLIVSEEGKGTLYQAVGLMIMIIWSVIFLYYFIWAVYYYNINYGYTDKDWVRIFRARRDKAMGIPIPEGSDKAPSHNPYRSQTFGLPPGTVRGMIAFTLLFGAIALTITSMGLNSEIDPNIFYWDHYEFYKTAFLMMIAFYFGDSSLRYLSKRWNATREATYRQSQKGKDDASNTPDAVEVAEEDFEKFELPSDPSSDEEKSKDIKALTSQLNLRKIVEMAGPDDTTLLKDIEEVKVKKLAEEYPQIADNEKAKVLVESDYQEAVDTLQDMGFEVQIPVLKAIVQIESSGSGFLDDGRAKILFEGHVFWRQLEAAGIDPKIKLSNNTDILYKEWTRDHYKGGKGEYERLQKAINIDEKAAIYSASWGKFQILGENLEHNIKSRIFNASNPVHVKNPSFYYDKDDIKDFYKKQQTSEYYHLLDFIAFITTKKISGKALISYVSGKDPNKFDWDTFALGYNGKGYKKNNYDTKLRRAYELFA